MNDKVMTSCGLVPWIRHVGDDFCLKECKIETVFLLMSFVLSLCNFSEN